VTDETTGPGPRAEHGRRYSRETPEELDAACDAAVDYRGDVTVHLDGGEGIEGYLYDRRRSDEPERAAVRLLPSDGGSRMTIPYARVVAIEFTGRDTAAGRTWENWVRRYIEQKLAGEEAGIEPE
jgi:hypothetical protein